MQGARIRELEAFVLEKQERTNAFREQAQEANCRLVRVVREVRDRTDNILTECGALVGEVVRNLAEGGQGNAAPSNLEEDPEEEPTAPEEESESVESVTN